MREIIYFLLNGLFHVAHITIILFVMMGWLFKPLLPFHLALTLLTLGSWFILGRWLGVGYCPVSDWHWKVKAALGAGRPNGTYIYFVLKNITGIELNVDIVDKMVVIGTIAIAGISLILNLHAWGILG
ncbi:DUF2784 family protein [Chitinimonas sp. PSY-7]|uniref:DUF2784 family protein n=1 Tax=Chitinimonas sp. PSY-7 TaxID=3459088 RepID=UPI0040401D2D